MNNEDPLPFKMSLDDSLSLWRAKTFWSKEPETIEWLNFYANKKREGCWTLVDVGANVGIYTLYWCTLDIESFAISVEPFGANFELLVSNVEMNEFKSRVKFVNKPLSSQNGYGVYEISDFRPGSSSFRFNIDNNINLSKLNLIDSLTLDSLLSETLGPKILKIDVDGNDFDILKGAELSLKNNDIISVLIESPEEQQYKIQKYLKEFGYEADYRFNNIKNHSDIRRKYKGNIERNRVYTKSDLVS